MKLRFYAREDQLAREPGQRPAIGQAARYIGRTFVPAKKERQNGADVVVEAASNPASKDAAEFDSERIDAADLDALKRHVRKGAIWCADAETAAFCGATFVPVEFKDGAWGAKAADKPKREIA
jgi:hypothetical protein